MFSRLLIGLCCCAYTCFASSIVLFNPGQASVINLAEDETYVYIYSPDERGVPLLKAEVIKKADVKRYFAEHPEASIDANPWLLDYIYMD